MKPGEINILIDMDCVLDTRQGALLLIDTDAAVRITTSKAYHARETDDLHDEILGGISADTLRAVQSKFKQDIIFKSVKTKMYLFLQELCSALIKSSMETPHASIITLNVNINGYEFTAQQCDLILKCIVHDLKGIVNVKLVDLDLQSEPLSSVASTYSIIIAYNPVNWLNSKHNELKTGVLKDINLYLPKMKMVREFTAQEKKTIEKSISDIYAFTATLFTGFIKLHYIPVECYCCDVPYAA